MAGTSDSSIHSENRPAGDIVLVVDLDGTLTKVDTLHESFLELVRKSPLGVFSSIPWLMNGKAYFKSQVADRATIDTTLIPYDDDVLDYIKREKGDGRKTVLATGASEKIATGIRDHLGLFDDVIATGGSLNVTGDVKAKQLVERYGHGGFDYIGNSRVDIPVWEVCNKPLMANAGPNLVETIRGRFPNTEILSKKEPTLAPLLKGMRPHQWAKNALIFIPMLAGQYLSLDNLIGTFLAFLSFSILASSIYLINDLLDLDSDRNHPRKKYRPLACGRLPIFTGIVAAGSLATLSFLISIFVSSKFVIVLLMYAILTTLYSFLLKKYALLDVVTLASLYTVRILAGAAAIEVPVTLWLLGFSMFLFTDLAFTKRYAEIVDMRKRNKEKSDGRGYRLGDDVALIALGTASGMTSVLTLALYVDSFDDSALYANPEFLWGVCPILLYWISRMWLAAQRGVMTDDPIVFAVRDRASRLMFLLLSVPIGLAVWY